MKKSRTDFGDELPLQAAIINGDKSNIYEILNQEDLDLSTVFTNGNRALHLLFKNFEEDDVIELLKAFLRKDVFLFHNNKHEETVFHVAVAKRMMKTIDFLLQNGFEIELLSENNPVTHFFIENEHKRFLALLKNIESEESKSIHFVEWLILKGFDFDRQNRFRESALHLAIKRNLQHILPTLLKHTHDINHIDEYLKTTLLHSFIQVNHAWKENKRIFSYKNAVGSDTFAQRYTTDIIKIMVDRGVDVDAVDRYGNTVLHKNVRANIQMGIFEIVLDRFTNVHHKDPDELTVLHAVTNMLSLPRPESINESYLRIMRSLIAKGSDVNSTDTYGSTPVYDVVKDTNLPAVKLMKEYNADFTMAPYGNTMLHALAMKDFDSTPSDESQEEIFELLIGAGCDVNALDYTGRSPLHLSIIHCSTFIVRKLLANGANVNCREKMRGMTLLHYATERRAPGLVELLLQKGAYVYTRDNDGKTALSRAVRTENSAMVEELLRHGANINESCVLRLVESCYEENYNGVLNPVLQHWIKLEAANLPRLKEYRAFIKDADHQKFYQECLEEIELLKTTFIGKQTTLYSFLQVNPNRRYAYAYCEILQKHVESPSFEKRFPKYSVLIQGNYHTAIARKSLMDKAKQVWQEMTEITLPEVCIELVLAFIDNADLINVAGVY